MRSADDPASLSPDERLAELAGIFAAAFKDCGVRLPRIAGQLEALKNSCKVTA